MKSLLMNKEKLSRIKEGIFLKSDVPWLKDYYLPDGLEDSAMKYAYCLYIDLTQEKRLISSYLCTSKTNKLYPNIKEKFVNYLKEYSPKKFKDLLLLTDAYPMDIKSLKRNFNSEQSLIFEVMECILRPSQGIILWHYQLENLLQLFFHPTEVPFIRKELNAQKGETWDKMKLVSINKSSSLGDFFTNRMLAFRKPTKTPNIKGAYELFKWVYS